MKEEIKYCCYVGNENIECDEIWCDECDFCPDSWFNEDDEEDED